MSINITTKRGDRGNTDILFGKSLPKTCPLFDLLNELDMIKVLLGKARMDQNISTSQGQSFLQLQKTIVQFSGALCVHQEDNQKYLKSRLDKFQLAGSIERIDSQIQAIQTCLDWSKTWSTPGPTKSADLDDEEEKLSFASIDLEMARIHARAAERHFLHFLDKTQKYSFEYNSEFKEIAPIWLNRLSDLLWLQAQILTQET